MLIPHVTVFKELTDGCYSACSNMPFRYIFLQAPKSHSKASCNMPIKASRFPAHVPLGLPFWSAQDLLISLSLVITCYIAHTGDHSSHHGHVQPGQHHCCLSQDLPSAGAAVPVFDRACQLPSCKPPIPKPCTTRLAPAVSASVPGGILVVSLTHSFCCCVLQGIDILQQ